MVVRTWRRGCPVPCVTVPATKATWLANCRTIAADLERETGLSVDCLEVSRACRRILGLEEEWE